LEKTTFIFTHKRRRWWSWQIRRTRGCYGRIRSWNWCWLNQINAT